MPLEEKKEEKEDSGEKFPEVQGENRDEEQTSLPFYIPDFATLLKKQGYALAGRHSAVKTCLWLRHAMNDQGFCYKSRFYGVQSHRCLQMTPTLICNQRCLFCWRPTEVPVPAPGEWDSPEKIVEESIACQRKLITGFGGSPNALRERWLEGNEPNNVAISLSGEPTFYPYLPELIEEYKKRGFTTFLVTNGTVPSMLAKINPSQLYMSLDAPDLETYLRVCQPKSPALWDRINESLDFMKEKSSRTVIRTTLVKGENMFNPEGYARLIKKASPDFVEIKAYMHLGFSRLRLDRSAMPTHAEVLEFSKELAKHLGYEITDESDISRVVLLSKDGKKSPVKNISYLD
ncbi:tRNA-modifying enzyme [Methanosarcina sp. 2.H.T.1A.6]|uniref:4-demethylwyosine synthase TYW1 n=1 Tax=unclassified Methanosarcina TaxID=2644672 RepID=UPI0006214BB0|nr:MULTISPECIES: 4-demethylwyosine synthase TYW1 [unclassified Methanosarcina]KKG17218.1 tRNA-modifying enzyme [Methanosarcina sp. 2.H.T.1A.15]KKG17329.1 tRNA-modifying enzyme [Methanosarcina sp. 2.H.T.1A.3]KKG20528.1 tRNA-modifying enzyme [Methanosarcina sp. 2.H.T.1A.6]KKG21379.1 tRNA-modifying enzyme [Methanosarcina sp. 2.H.T.1A.8]